MSLKSVGKVYPTFNKPSFVGNGISVPRNIQSLLKKKAPGRFGTIYGRGYIPREKENFIAFCGNEIDFTSKGSCLKQTAYRIYDEPILLPFISGFDRVQLVGEVDFLCSGNVSFKGPNNTLLDITTYSTEYRYPFRMATYYPIRNCLIFPNFFSNSDDIDESLINFIKWVLKRVEGVGYKYSKRGYDLLIGCDPEFNVLSLDGKKLRTGDYFSTDMGAPVGCDGNSGSGPGELRPDPASCPLQLTNNLRKLMSEVAIIAGEDKKITTGGGRGIAPIGHHIHFNIFQFERELKELLDLFIGHPSSNIEGADRGSNTYGIVGKNDVEIKTHGIEYRTPASSLYPELTDALHTTAFCIVEKWESIMEGEKFEFEVDDKTGIPTREAYIGLDFTDDKKYTKYLEEYWKWVMRKDGRKIEPTRDCLWRWVPGRKEVKEVPGIKLNWDPRIKAEITVPSFIENETLDKIYELYISSQETISGKNKDTEYSNAVFLSVEKKPPVSELKRIKSKYNLTKITGSGETDTIRISISDDLITSLGEKLVEFVIELINVLI